MTHEYEQQISFEKRLLVGVFCLLVCLSGLYVYLVNQTVKHVVDRRSLEAETTELTSRIAVLEETYTEQKRTFTPEYAYELGFHEIAHVSYVARETIARN